ncbi:protein FdrA [Nocardioides soli]|uniref:FdrA protein n=1 Tax=Nocardioides soli TaxID=1036020 RepID=A0A7W4Z1N3_9ACTN|nr:protein FdrA [Nocardioides soli]MBB3043052.1 FdrA protein [Nocardioides soli]
MTTRVTVRKNAYKDSVRLLEATRAVLESPGVDWGWALMATPANLETLAEQGITEGLTGAVANDLVIAATADSEESAERALAVAEATLFEAGSAEQDEIERTAADLGAALVEHPAANVAIVSVPGAYAALETHKALTAGLDVLLFSDNVPLPQEVELKQRARALGRLVMGPGAGTAMLAGVGLGFANRVSPGPVGVVAAAGTGAQEVMSLLHGWGVGVTHVIGVGGRDLSPDVDGLMAESALRALDADDRTEAILLVSKPPSREVAERLLGIVRKPMVAALMGLQETLAAPDHVRVVNTLEAGAVRTLALAGGTEPDLVGDLGEQVATAITGLPQDRRKLVGLYSGGTLCYEALTIVTPHLGPIHSNVPLEKGLTPETAAPGDHLFLDLGEEEYTQGRPHPMIDPQARVEFLHQQADDPAVAAVLLDVVIGDGAHADPAGMLAPAVEKVIASGAVVVAYVLGTDLDPQNRAVQVATLRAAGCVVAPTAARAALAGAAISLRDPALVAQEL